MPASAENLVIFDFDGTIVSKNTGSEFYKWMARQSLLRVILLALLLPLLVPLRIFAFFTNNALAQKTGINIVCLVSTAFLQVSLFRLRSRFIRYYLSRCGAVVHQDALKRLRQHQAQGDTVVIISGCPDWILHGLAKAIGIKGVKLIGSKLAFSWKGLLLADHCHQHNKVIMAQKQGIDFSRCSHAYSDSVTDKAILDLTRHAVLVNTTFVEKWYFRLFFRHPVSFEQWQ